MPTLNIKCQIIIFAVGILWLSEKGGCILCSSVSLILCSLFCIIGSFSKLTPHNYATWKEKIKELLVEKGLLCYVSGAAKKIDDDVDESHKEHWESK